MTVTDKINALSMSEVAERYGFKVNRAGFIPCPFHTEKTASLKTYSDGRGWYCFGCGAGGDVIDFVRRLYNLDFAGAVTRISFDFGLNLTSRRPTDRSRLSRVARERQERREQINELETYLNAVAAKFRRLWAVMLENKPTSRTEPPPPEWSAAVGEIGYIDYLIETAENELRELTEGRVASG